MVEPAGCRLAVWIDLAGWRVRSRFPVGNDRKKGKSKGKSKSRLPDGNDRKKGKSKGKSKNKGKCKSEGTSKCRSFASVVDKSSELAVASRH